MPDNPPHDPLLDDVAEIVRADAVPDHVIEAAKASFTWRTIDAELAALAFDSAVDEMAGVRSAGDDRHLTFRAAGLEIELVLSAGTRTLTGQLIPPQPGTVELRSTTTSRQAAANDHGVFSFAGVPTGPLSLRCVVAGANPVCTEWLAI